MGQNSLKGRGDPGVCLTFWAFALQILLRNHRSIAGPSATQWSIAPGLWKLTPFYPPLSLPATGKAAKVLEEPTCPGGYFKKAEVFGGLMSLETLRLGGYTFEEGGREGGKEGRKAGRKEGKKEKTNQRKERNKKGKQ
ncbi:hypothetical protein L345_18188, partial [Ophiophagus hannah]